MNCNCFIEAQKKLREKTGDENASFEISFVIKDGKISSFPCIPAKYRKKKANGELKLKPSINYILGSFCPICGKKAN